MPFARHWVQATPGSNRKRIRREIIGPFRPEFRALLTLVWPVLCRPVAVWTGLNLRPAGGGVFERPPPLWFFADSKKTAARSAAGFSPTLSPIFLPTFVKVSILGHARSGHQVRSNDHTLQKPYNRAPATVFEGKLWNFRNMMRSSVPTKCISWIFDIGDLRSGHFRDLPIISQWAKIKLPVLCFIFSLYEWNRIR